MAVGFGTAGCRILSHLEKTGINVDSYAYLSCEKQDLECSSSGRRLFIDIGFRGKSTPSHVRGVAQKYMKEIRRILSGSRLVFLVAGLGGCTGSGLIPLVAKVAKEEGLLTVSVIAMPFGFEKSKHFYAGISLKNVRQNSDAVIIIDNDIISSDEEQIPIPRFYSLVNERISAALSRIVESSGELSVGLNRLVDTITNDGYTVLGIGTSSSINKAEEATVKAVESVYGIVEPEEASSAILYLVGDKSIAANELTTSTSRLNTMLGKGALEVHQGFTGKGGETMIAILLASGFRTTKFDDYDPLEKVLHNRQIDSDMECGIDEDLSNLVQIE
ncbi:MAG: hypothetical protein ACE5KU_01320 [Nitrososphaerales archaeon]